MTKEEAKLKTKERFTNLYGGGVINGVGVGKIIDYYEELIAKGVAQAKMRNNIIDKFTENKIDYEFKQLEE